MGFSIKKLLVANRSEIAIRIFRASSELGIRTVAIYAEEDRLSLHRFKADEAFPLDKAKGPLGAYLSIEDVVRIAREADVDAIHPGYGFLAESPEFAEACTAAGIVFVGPHAETMRTLGNKVSARNLAISVGVPVMPASGVLPDDSNEIRNCAAEIGYPLMIKASWGGGGRGMRTVECEEMLLDTVEIARREARSAFGKDEVYLEKLVQEARHVEVQLLGDGHGNVMHLFERDCSVQRRHQKVIERAPAPYLQEVDRAVLCDASLKIGRATGYVGAGTVEFLMDARTGGFYFIEVNPRIQVEHTVTEAVTGLDIVKAQIRIAEGGRLGVEAETGIPAQRDVLLNGHAVQCRITTENPENNFAPDDGRIVSYRGASGFGVRVDGGSAYSGAFVTRYYDPLLEKVTAWGRTPADAISRMKRALSEYSIRGVATNLSFLQAVISHPQFHRNEYTTRFIDEVPELVETLKRQDRGTKLLTYIADVTVNGHPDVRGRTRRCVDAEPPRLPEHGYSCKVNANTAAGTRQILDKLGAKGFADWMRGEGRLLITDTTMRDAHQSLLATRLRTFDLVAVGETYARTLPQLLSLECWGGATFDVAMRFLIEDPWERLAALRQKVPNILLQALIRGANGVGYANYPDNVVRHFVRQAATSGVDLFRIFDCLNWVDNMRVAIDAVGEAGKLAEGAICYTGNILDPSRTRYSLRYYIDLAKQLEKAGCHILCIKDMAGLLRPAAAKMLVKALREEIGLPIHLHTHDTSGIAAASVLAAVEAGVDAVDAAMDAMSGSTSQPCLGSLVEALRQTPRETGLDSEAIQQVSGYWGDVRKQYAAFESDLRSGTSEVYLHEMPGGQFTNLREQARSMGLDKRWPEVTKAYRSANDLLGDIVKVTPTSKVVGDMALMMVAQNLTAEDVLDPSREISFPVSVVEMLRGDLGQPPGGWPVALQGKVLKGQPSSTLRPGSSLPPADLSCERLEAAKRCGRAVSESEFSSYLMYPKIFAEYCELSKKYGPVASLPTSAFFYGMQAEGAISVAIETGKTLVIRLNAIGEMDEDGYVRVFFELNGQPRTIAVSDRSAEARRPTRRKADGLNDRHVAAPIPGLVTMVVVRAGQQVKAGDILVTVEAMKMETSIRASRSGSVAEVFVNAGDQIRPMDLLLTID